MSTLPSVDPPSITTCSMGKYVCAATEARLSASHARWFRDGVRIDTSITDRSSGESRAAAPPSRLNGLTAVSGRAQDEVAVTRVPVLTELVTKAMAASPFAKSLPGEPDPVVPPYASAMDAKCAHRETCESGAWGFLHFIHRFPVIDLRTDIRIPADSRHSPNFRSTAGCYRSLLAFGGWRYLPSWTNLRPVSPLSSPVAPRLPVSV